MRINLEIFEATEAEVMNLVNALNASGASISVSNYATAAAAVPEQKEKKITINDIWENMLNELPRAFDKYGIGRYCAPSKLSSNSDELDRYFEIRLKNDYIILNIPSPDNEYSDIPFKKYTSRIYSSFNDQYFGELLDQTVPDPEMRSFIEKYFSK